MQSQTLSEWLRNHSESERKALASDCKTTVAYLYQLAGGHRVPSLRLAMDIANHTGGAVPAASFVKAEGA